MENARIICFYCVSTHLGGAEQSLIDIVSNLEKLSNGTLKPWLLLPQSEGPLIDILKERDIDYSVLEMPKLFMKTSREKKLKSMLLFSGAIPQLVRYLDSVSNEIKKKNPSAVYSTGLKCHVALTLLSKKLKTPLFLHFRDLLNSPTLFMFFKIFGKKKNIKYLSNSLATQDTLPIRSAVIYNGFDLKKFADAEPIGLRASYNISEDTPLIGILGALAHWKGQKLFIDIANQLIHKGSNAHFFIIGDEIYDTVGDHGIKKELHDLVQELKIESRIHFLGFQKKPENALKELDILVHASLRPEPFGRVIVEGMASNCVVIAADDGGAKEIVTHEKNGFLCKTGNSDDYRQTIEKVLLSPDQFEKVQKAAIEKVRKDFCLETQLLKLVSLFNENIKN